MQTEDERRDQEWAKSAIEAARRAVQRVGCDARDREEITGQTVAGLARYAPQHPSGPALDSLALVIARRALIDLIRRRSARGIEQTLDSAGATAAADAEVGPDERTELIRSLVESLTPEQRLAVRLHVIEGRDLRSTAAIMGMAESTLRRRIASAIQAMERVREAWEGGQNR